MANNKKNDKNERIDFFVDQFLGMKHKHEVKESGVNALGGNGAWSIEEIDPSKAIRRSFEPDHPFLVSFGLGIKDETSERLFSDDAGHLVSDIKTLIGKGFECALLDGLSVVWVKVVPTDLKRLKGVSAARHDAAFEWHYRRQCFDGSGEYVKCLAVTYKNKSVPVFYNGKPWENVGDKLIAFSSMVEDILRKDVFHATFTNKETGKGLKIALSGEGIVDLMKFRESPTTETGRKRPVLHWVKEHLRKTQGVTSQNVRVEKYERGIDDFESDGYVVSINVPEETFETMASKQ